MSPKSDSHSQGPTNVRSPGVDNDVEYRVPFNPSRYPDDETGSMYMLPPYSSPSWTKTHDRKHRIKKVGQHYRQTKYNKLDLISPLPGCQENSIHHSSKYDRKKSRAGKNAAGSNHTSDKKYYGSCHLNPYFDTRRYTATMKKKGTGVVNSISPLNSKLYSEHLSSLKWIFHEPTVQVSKQKVPLSSPVQKAYLV